MKIGTKAQNLIKLQDLGYYVPPFHILPFADILLDFTAITAEISKIAKAYFDEKISLDKYTSQTRKILTKIKLDTTKIKHLSKELTQNGFSKVSFRTSALGEDGPKFSFAGQYQTFLNKPITEKTIKKYTEQCFASTIDARIIQYLKHHKINRLALGGSVIIQQMFYGKQCGVLFTEDSTGCITINLVDSWQNTVVEGSLAKTFYLKKTQLDHARAPKILKQLAKASIQLENEMQTPLDIEWSIRGNKIAYLQMRPQTTRNPNYFFEWDSTNISESYPGITLPLTYSFIRNLYAKVYPSFLSMIGTPKSVLESNREVFDNALGFLDGRVYYRISNWYEIVKLIPGKNNQQYFEAMLNPAKKRHPKTEPTKFDPKSTYTALRFFRLLLSSPRLSKKFKKIFNTRFPIYDNSKMEFMNANALFSHIQSVQNELLSLWAIPILNDVRVMIWHGILKNTVTKHANHEAYLELLRGLSYRSSIKPLLALHDLGIKLHAEMQSAEITSIDKLATHAPAVQLARNYILEYGARTPDELKLENPRLVDSLHDVMTLALKAKDNPIAPITKSKIDLSNFSPAKRAFLRIIIKNTRSAIDWREHFRLNRAQVYNLARQAYLQIGEIFVRDKIFARQDDIFYLTSSEIENIINGHAWEYTAQDLITRRKKLYQKYTHRKLSRRITGDGAIAARHLTAAPATDSDNAELTGMGVSPGAITAKAIVATEFDPNLDVRGKILIAPHIDPGWTLIFTQAIGVITERGNALSHVSIISRELGIPAIVALDQATKKIQTGQNITINGSTGEVTINDKS